MQGPPGLVQVMDKALHIGAGAVIALVTLGIWLTPSGAGAMLLAGIFAGVGYEAVQAYRGQGEPDPLDALATFLGAALIAGLYFALWEGA